MHDLSGRVAIVTGAGGGIGLGTAKVLAQHGAYVMLLDYDAKVEAAAAELQQAGFAVEARQADVRDLPALQQLVADLVGRKGQIDILFNNAGINSRSSFEDFDPAVCANIFAVNIQGVWNMAKAVYPYMLKAKYGRIINTASVTGVMVVDEGQTAYGTSKAAVSGFTKALAVEAAPHGITVNAVLPGWVRTPLVEERARKNRPEDPEGVFADMAAGIPMLRLCLPEEIGELVAFLASEQAAYITGSNHVIDGGSTLPETFGILKAK